MKKISHLSTISSIIVLAFIVPQIAFAAWWNPISWFNGLSFFHRTDTQTQVLENRVKELEKQLGNTATTTPADTKIVETAAPKKVVPVVVPAKAVTPIQLNPPVTNSQPSGTLCNGTYWSPCPSGQQFVCPTSGGAYCSIPSSQSTTHTASSDYAQCLNDVTALIKQKEAEYKAKEQQCLADNAGNWQAPILCTYSVDTSLMYSACTGSYNPPPATTNSQPSVPTQTQSGFDAIESLEAKQAQETFERDTCQKLGGAYIGDTCSY